MIGRLAEALVVGAAGGIVGGEMLGSLGAYWAGAAAGGISGTISGYARIYDWSDLRGSLAFLLDCTWGLALTAAGVLVHAANLAVPSDYRAELSERRNRHVYGGGARARRGFAWTVGNVVSNAGSDHLDDDATAARRRLFVERHEDLHIWQNRLLGPLYPTLYVAWLLIGGIVGTALWLRRGGSWWRTVDTVAYFDNPFEYAAYRRDERWPHPAADATLSWGGGRNVAR